MACPKCGVAEFKEGRQCPELGGEVVCVKCCYQCAYYRHDIFRCLYYTSRKTPFIDYGNEIVKINARIEQKEKMMKWLYDKKRPNPARIIESEINELKREKQELVDKRNQN